MKYDDINSYTSHAGVFLRKAEQLMSSVDTALWNAKIRDADDPIRKDVTRMNQMLDEIGSCMEAALKDLNVLKEEMKMYNK